MPGLSSYTCPQSVQEPGRCQKFHSERFRRFQARKRVSVLTIDTNSGFSFFTQQVGDTGQPSRRTASGRFPRRASRHSSATAKATAGSDKRPMEYGFGRAGVPESRVKQRARRAAGCPPHSDFGFLSDFGFRASDFAPWLPPCALCQNDPQFFSKLRIRSSCLARSRICLGSVNLGTLRKGSSLLVCQGCLGCLPPSQVGGGRGGKNRFGGLRNWGNTPALSPSDPDAVSGLRSARVAEGARQRVPVNWSGTGGKIVAAGRWAGRRCWSREWGSAQTRMGTPDSWRIAVASR